MRPGRSFPLIFFCLVSGIAQAQSYQSSFASILYDRALTPATLAGPVEVDAPSGAASLHLALGPGIGRGDLRFIPALNGRFAPLMWGQEVLTDSVDSPPFLWPDSTLSFQAAVATVDARYNAYFLLTGGGATFTPGFFELVCQNHHGGTRVSNFLLPDGSSCSLGGTAPAAVVADQAATVLADFHYPASTQVGPMPAPEDQIASSPGFIRMSTSDDLVLGLTDPAYPAVKAEDANGPSWVLPGRILVVRGAIAYEFAYVQTFNTDVHIPLPRTLSQPGGKTYNSPYYGQYHLSRILNRFREAIEFNHAPNGTLSDVEYNATWTKDGSPIVEGERLEVRLLPLPALQVPSIPILLDPFLSAYPSQLASIRVSYAGAGFGNPSSYLLEAYDSAGGPVCLNDENAFCRNLQPVRVTQEADGQQVAFTYGTLGGDPQSGGQLTEEQTGALVPRRVTVLQRVTMPGRIIDLDWKPYPWRKNVLGGFEQDGFFSPGTPWSLPQFFFGVQKIRDSGRTTDHIRVVPTPDFSASGSGGWQDLTFYDAIVHPDQSVTLHRFVSPVAGSASMPTPASTPAQTMQTLAFLKHLVQETRTYAQGADWRSDLGTDAGASTAVAIERGDRLTLQRPGNPSGSFGAGSVPFPTRSQARDLESGVLTWEESTDWDAVNLGWTNLVRRAYLAPLSGFEWLPGGTAATASPYDQSAARSLDSDFLHHWLARVAYETPVGMPVSHRTWNGDGTLQYQQLSGDGAYVRASFTYTSGTPLPETVTLTGKDASGPLALTGEVGIASYAYDPHGFLTSIKPLGVTWSTSQASDAFGRPVSQTDANSLERTLAWDEAGRLSSILPSFSNEADTQIAYDPDALGATVTRGGGAEWRQARYDGFGQLVLARRSDGSTRSHQRFDYDAMGRKTAESVWLAGDGTDTESTAGKVRTEWGYDARGRISSIKDPNGVLTTFDTQGLTTVQTVAPGTPDEKVTRIERDPLNRIARITDVRSEGNYVTEYAYDAGGRLSAVTQSGDGRTQTRSWHYDHPLKWLTSLVQPESGTTSCGSFDVAGRPGTTTCGGVTVTTTRDALGRVVQVTSPGGGGLSPVNQTFTYDQALDDSGSAFGLPVTAQDGDVRLDYRYDSEAHRLSRLDTTIGSVTYAQSFTTNAFGRRTSATVDGRTLILDVNDATGRPMKATYSGGGLTNAVVGKVSEMDPVSWQPIHVTHPATSASSDFRYQPDQITFASRALYPTGTGSPYVQWNYQFDFAGRIKGDGIDSYAYDTLDRLKGAVILSSDGKTQISQAFAYDPFGNLTKTTTSLDFGTPVPDINDFEFKGSELDALAQTNRIPASASGVPTAAEYDAQGHLLSIAKVKGASTPAIGLVYDALGRVVGLTDNGREEIYGYTPDGLRTSVQVFEGGALSMVQHRLYNDQDQLVSEYEAK